MLESVIALASINPKKFLEKKGDLKQQLHPLLQDKMEDETQQIMSRIRGSPNTIDDMSSLYERYRLYSNLTDKIQAIEKVARTYKLHDKARLDMDAYVDRYRDYWNKSRELF
jgi:hypothetical protein